MAVVGTREPRELGSTEPGGRNAFIEELRLLWGDQDLPHRRLLIGSAMVVTLIGVGLRFHTPSALWLDEAISVNIAKLPLVQIPSALSHDGAPPLYYVLLHVWMLVAGQGDIAVRALSAVLSVAALPFFWIAGRRIGGRLTGWALYFLALGSPFAISYATATRMYSLMILLSLLGFLALEHALEAPTRRNLVQLGIVTAAVLYTHYWGLYLIAATMGWLLIRIGKERRSHVVDRLAVRPAFAAMLVGSLFFLPWTPVFAFQTLHTGTPWASSAGPADLIGVFGDFSGSGPWGALLALVFFALVGLGLFGRRPVRGPRRSNQRDGQGDDEATTAVHIVTEPLPRLVALAGILLATLVLAVAAGAVANAAFVARYAAAVLPLFLILAAVGATVFADRRIVAVVLVVAVVAGLLTGFGTNSEQRTQAGEVAKVLNADAQSGDLVVYCPDQLGPAVDRLLTVPDVTELTFPRAIGPSRVDWVDYTSAIKTTNVGAFAQQMLGQLGADHTLWVVERDGYTGFGGSCGALVSWFNLLRPTGVTVVHADNGYYENENLLRYPT